MVVSPAQSAASGRYVSRLYTGSHIRTCQNKKRCKSILNIHLSECTPFCGELQGRIISVAERLTKASAWYPWHREEVHHGYHQAMGSQWRGRSPGHRTGRVGPPRYGERRVDR